MQRSYILHAVIWSILVFAPIFVLPGDERFGLTRVFYILSSLFHVSLFYFNAYFLYPKLLRKKVWVFYPVAIGIVFFLCYYIKLFFLKLDPNFRITEENHKIILFGAFPILIAIIIFRLNDRIRFEETNHPTVKFQITWKKYHAWGSFLSAYHFIY